MVKPPTEFYLCRDVRADGSEYFVVATTPQETAEWLACDFVKQRVDAVVWRVKIGSAVEMELVPAIPASVRVKPYARMEEAQDHNDGKEKDA